MWGSDGRGASQSYQPDATRRSLGQPAGVERPAASDAGALDTAFDGSADVGTLDEEFAGGPSDVADASWNRLHARQLIREFLRAVPRSETEASIAFVRPDGTPRVLTRAQLSTAIDRLRPRQRQIVRLAVEERWPRQKVCEYLHNISLKTFERDQVEALDILAQL